jgi:broad-specificity NMP kinase
MQGCRREAWTGRSATDSSAAAAAHQLLKSIPLPRVLACLPARRWFDLVVVLQTDNTVLWERLEKR